MMKQRALTYILLVGALFGLARCSEIAGSGELVDIPSVSFTCSAGNCGGPGTRNLFRVIYSTFGCDNAGDESFNARRTKTGFLNCNGTSCSGTASGAWKDSNFADTTLIPADSYTICIVVFRDSGFETGATSDDAYAEENVVVSSSSPPFNISTFSNGVP